MESIETGLIDPPIVPAEPITDWGHKGYCRERDPEDFFAPDGEKADARYVREAIAKVICSKCSVLDVCFAWAYQTRAVGVWGGTTDEERDALRAHLRQQKQAASA